jgi:uncharacterized protein (DUF4415 family)
MKPKEDIRQYSMDEIKEMIARGEDQTRDDAPVYEVDEDFWKNAYVVRPGDKPKTSVHLRLDPEVFDWFKAQGKGHLTHMSAVLRACYEAKSKGKQ